MANLDDKFDVLRGWEPGGDAGVDQSFEPAETGGVPNTLTPGTIVTLAADGTVDAATTPDTSVADPINVWVVVEGNGDDTAAQFVDKVVCLRGKLTVKTDKIASAQTFAVGSPVSFDSGLLTDKAANEQILGYVSENNEATDGTVTVELDL